MGSTRGASSASAAAGRAAAASAAAVDGLADEAMSSADATANTLVVKPASGITRFEFLLFSLLLLSKAAIEAVTLLVGSGAVSPTGPNRRLLS